MRRIKVAFLIPSLSGGGAERATATLASNLDQSVFEPILLLASERPHVYQPAPGVRVVSLAAPSTRSALRPLVGFLRREKPDVLYAALPHLNVAAALARVVARPRPRLVVSIHNNQRLELGEVKHGRLMRWIMPWTYRSAAATIAVSEGIANELRPTVAYPDRIHVIPNPLGIEAIIRQAAAEVHHPWLEGNHQVVTAMGRLTRQKNFASLLEAFASVAGAKPDARLMILGEGEDRPDLERQAEDLGIGALVEFLGFVENPFAILARSSCFAMSSLWEGFGLVLVEAMAAGVPIVATDCPYGPAEILGHGRYGHLVPPGDAAALAAAIISMLDDPTLSHGFIDAGRAHAWEFDAGAVTPKLAQLLESLAGPIE